VPRIDQGWSMKAGVKEDMKWSEGWGVLAAMACAVAALAMAGGPTAWRCA
jgi:hypothetical protein